MTPIRTHKAELMPKWLKLEQMTVQMSRPLCKIDNNTCNYRVTIMDNEVTCQMCLRKLREREEIRLANV